MIDSNRAGHSFPHEHEVQARRSIFAIAFSATATWYGFELYGTVTALVFGRLFFPNSSPIAGLLGAYSIFFAGFVGRPIGAALFGHWGDRIGRKVALTFSLVVTGVATVLVGCVPGFPSIGIWAPILLTMVRLIQGIGLGGEWGGSVLLIVESARSNKNRGLLSAWAQFGSPAGLILANCAVLLFSSLSGDQFFVWGWRIPFLLGAVILAGGLWTQLSIPESPIFQRMIEEHRTERTPVWEVLKRQPKQLALTALLRLPEQAPAYIVGAWIFGYGTTVLGVSRDLLLWGVIVQTVIGSIWVIVSGHLSDIIGRKKLFIIGCLLTGVFAFVYVAMLNSGVPWVIFLAIAVSLLPGMTQYGAQAALIAENFTPRLRYSGTSLGYHLSSIIAGGPAPFIATWLFARYHSAWPIAVYIALCAVIGGLAAAFLTDHTGKSIASEYTGI
jgi:MFS family permease